MEALAGVENLGLQGLPPRKSQELSGQPRRAVDRVGDCVDIAPPPLLRQVRAAQQVRAGANDRQQVVEIMRHAASELADGFHLLRLAELFLRLQQLG